MPPVLQRLLQSFLLASLLLLQILIQPAQGPKDPVQQVAAIGITGAPGEVQEASFTLDGVKVTIQVPFPLALTFYASQPGDATQVATAASWRPFREVSITAVPFGSRPGTEGLPVAAAGGWVEYEAVLRQYRRNQDAEILVGPAASLFGQRVVGQASIVNLNLDSQALKPTLIVEWVVEAGNRLWIMRVSEEQPSGAAGLESGPALQSLGGLTLVSNNLNAPSTSSPLARPVPETEPPASGPIAGSGVPVAGDLPTPPWWNGSDCDYNHYYAGSGGRGSYRLGAVYQGLPACGPRPYSDKAPDVLVSFFPGAWGEYEWECVELSMRYLYLAYGIAPYSANGKDVVWNYSGTALLKIGNGTPHAAPQPGDVLSYGPTSPWGHTSVVTASSIDGNGNGSLTVIEENYSSNGANTLSVTNWTVNGNAGAVSGWLHWPLSPRLFFPVVFKS